MILFYLHFISLKYVYWVWSHIHLVRNLLCDFKKSMFHIVWMSVELMKFWCTTSAILSQSSDMVSVAWTASVPFTTPLPWPHGIVKCPLDAHFRISPEVVRHLYIFGLLLYEYYDYGYTMAHILFFYYMEVGIFGHWLVLVSLKPTFPRKPNLFWLVSSLKHAGNVTPLTVIGVQFPKLHEQL